VIQSIGRGPDGTQRGAEGAPRTTAFRASQNVQLERWHRCVMCQTCPPIRYRFARGIVSSTQTHHFEIEIDFLITESSDARGHFANASRSLRWSDPQGTGPQPSFPSKQTSLNRGMSPDTLRP
jgi:hypothetical protein